jgi:hypothetical protein
MPQHHPLQKDLAIKIAAVRDAEAKLATLHDRKRALNERLQAALQLQHDGSDAVRKAAGDVAAGETPADTLKKARDSYAAATMEAELAELEVNGLGERIEQAEKVVDRAQRDMHLAAIDICRVIAVDQAAAAVNLFELFCRTQSRHHAIARLAHRANNAATGREAGAPIPYQRGNGAGGAIDNIKRVMKESHLTGWYEAAASLQPASIDDLLEYTLPAAAEAAE